MSALKIGELFAGYGGLGMGVQAALGGDIAWVSEFDKGPSKILAHRFPGVPNHGDITKIDWSQVEPVDILTGGSPCQDLSHAGKRQGMTEGTRSNLWVAMREAIAALRPSLVVWENVRGAGSAEATSDLEFCPGCMGDGRPRTVLRALGRVVGDLSDLGYVGQVRGLRAADCGSCHGRFRYFLTATDAERGGFDGWARASRRGSLQRVATQGSGEGALLPTPVADNSRGLPSSGTDFQSLPNAVCALLPTPAVNDMGASYTPDEWDAWTDRMKAEHGNGNGHGKSLHIEAARLLPTPTTMDGHASGGGYNGQTNVTLTDATSRPDMPHVPEWGQYAAAIQRWESLTRPAPAPTELGPKGNPRLSAAFSEWMMGLPAGWVTDVPGITRNEALKALGNGVVPQQAAAALRMMLGAEVSAA